MNINNTYYVVNQEVFHWLVNFSYTSYLNKNIIIYAEKVSFFSSYT
jgi:hypothetical protein